MTAPIQIPHTNAYCELCDQKTDFQAQFVVEVSVLESLSVEARAFWFCTECYEQEIVCDTDIAWSN